MIVCYNNDHLQKRKAIMKKFIGKQKNCFWTLLGLILVCEILLKIDNKIIQSIGIVLTPFIVMFGYLLIRNDEKNLTQKNEEN